MPLLQRRNGSIWRLGLGVVMLMLILVMSPLQAQGASSIAQGFQSDDSNTVPGALVSLKSGTASTVELSTVRNVDRLLGVVGENSLIELSNGAGGLQVVTSGETTTLVSDINGTVKTGDKIAPSPIAGVGMKALTSTVVIGTAQADLTDVQTQARTITTKNGKQQSVHIGAIPVQVDKVFYEAPQENSAFLPPAFQEFASRVAGHEVSPVRVMVAAFLVALLFIVVAILLYSAVRSSIISIGRNPLSETAVRKSLVQVGVAVLIVSLFTIGVIYLILTT